MRLSELWRAQAQRRSRKRPQTDTTDSEDEHQTVGQPSEAFRPQIVASPSRDAQVQELLTVERYFDGALLSADVAALEQILSERFFLNDFTGGVVPRAALLNYLRDGKLRFHHITPHDISARHDGETGIVTGWTEMKVELQGVVSEVKSRFLNVHIKQRGTWRLIAAQGTVIAELDS